MINGRDLGVPCDECGSTDGWICDWCRSEIDVEGSLLLREENTRLRQAITAYEELIAKFTADVHALRYG